MPRFVRFGDYQADLQTGELRKNGAKIRLSGQPFQILALLLEQPGELITREELRARLWPDEVFVDFDHSVNAAVNKLREALCDSTSDARFIETLPKRGYRFIAPVIGCEEKNGADVLTAEKERRADTQPAERAHRPRTRRAARWLIPGLAAGFALIAVTYVMFRRHHATGASPPSGKAILAVLPFDNLSHDPDQEFFSDGLTEEMITQLSKLNPERLSVIARGSVQKYKGRGIAVSEVGKELHADYLVQGSTRRAADHVRISVQLIQIRDQTDLWAESYDGELKDILALQASVARTIANQIHITLAAGQQAQLATLRELEPAAYEAYLKGRYYWNKRTADGLQKATIYFQQAINKDPGYGAAYSGLADCSSGLAWHGFKSPAETLPKANAAALKAIEIDPDSAEAHASLGLALHHRLDWPGAEAGFKRALQLDRHYANAHHWYGDYLSIKGRHDEALVEAKQALELDPLNLMIGTWVGLRYYLARKYDRAIEQGRNTVELDPNFAAAHLLLGESYVQMGLEKQALAELETAASLSGSSPLYLAQVGVAHASAGRKTEALRIIDQLRRVSRERYVSPYGLAQIYAALNDREQTFTWLQTAYDDHAVWISYLAVDPVFDRFRSDPRFRNLLRRLSLLP